MFNGKNIIASRTNNNCYFLNNIKQTAIGQEPNKMFLIFFLI